VKNLIVFAALLFSAQVAFSQTVSNCPTATPGSVWSKSVFLPCSTAVDYLPQPLSKSAIISDLRCAASNCQGSWQRGSNVRSTDQVWVKTTAYPSGTWVEASTLKFATYPPCTQLVYVGAPFTMVTTTGPHNATVTSPVVGTVTLINPLPANGTTTFAPGDGGFIPTPGLVSWDFSSQDPLLSSLLDVGNPYAQPTFTFTTRGGLIVGWNFTVPRFQNLEVGSFNESIKSSSSSGDTVSVVVNPIPIPPDTVPYSIIGSNNTPGTWTCQTTFSSNFP
jgi:hypothetical protein